MFIAERLELTNDYVFKRIFGYKGSENITKVFLEDILNIKITEIELDCSTITEKEVMNDKVGVLDIKVNCGNTEQYDIEMQVASPKYIEKRLLFYWAKLYSQSIKVGENYKDLKNTKIILIADFKLSNLKNIEKVITKWKIREEEYKSTILTDVFEICIIELPKYKEYNEKLKSKKTNLWINFIKNPGEKIMSNDEELKETKKAIEEAQEKLEEISNDEHERYLAHLREKYILDHNSAIYAAIEEVAQKMLENDIDMETIIKCTGLSKEKIEKLK